MTLRSCNDPGVNAIALDYFRDPRQRQVTLARLSNAAK